MRALSEWRMDSYLKHSSGLLVFVALRFPEAPFRLPPPGAVTRFTTSCQQRNTCQDRDRSHCQARNGSIKPTDHCYIAVIESRQQSRYCKHMTDRGLTVTGGVLTPGYNGANRPNGMRCLPVWLPGDKIRELKRAIKLAFVLRSEEVI